MTVFVKKVQNKNRKIEGTYGKYYGRVAILDEVSLEELASEIQENCTVKRSDILAVLSEMGPVIKRQLQKSFKVRIPYLGVFKMGIRSMGVENPDDYDVKQHVKGLKVKFVPEYTIEQGHIVKEFTRGTKLAVLPKNLFGQVIDDDSEEGADVLPDNEPGNQSGNQGDNQPGNQGGSEPGNQFDNQGDNEGDDSTVIVEQP